VNRFSIHALTILATKNQRTDKNKYQQHQQQATPIKANQNRHALLLQTNTTHRNSA